MRRIVLSSALAILGAIGSAAQTSGPAACCSGQSVELKGKVAKVQIASGEGTPYLELNSGDRTVRLYLGAMRYLVAQGFNPKVGEELTAKAYSEQKGYIAASVTLAGGKTLVLRDENGRPVWRGGFRGGRPSR